MNVINIHDSSRALHRVAVTDAFSLRAKRSSHRFAVALCDPSSQLKNTLEEECIGGPLDDDHR